MLALLLFGAITLGASGLAVTSPVLAAPSAVQNELCQGSGNSVTTTDPNTGAKTITCPTDSSGNINTGQALQNKIGAIISTLLLVAAAVAVLIIIFGGIGYITSIGDATRIKQAKDTILYAVIGLIAVILAYAIVNFIIGRF